MLRLRSAVIPRKCENQQKSTKTADSAPFVQFSLSLLIPLELFETLSKFVSLFSFFSRTPLTWSKQKMFFCKIVCVWGYLEERKDEQMPPWSTKKTQLRFLVPTCSAYPHLTWWFAEGESGEISELRGIGWKHFQPSSSGQSTPLTKPCAPFPHIFQGRLLGNWFFTTTGAGASGRSTSKNQYW